MEDPALLGSWRKTLNKGKLKKDRIHLIEPMDVDKTWSRSRPAKDISDVEILFIALPLSQVFETVHQVAGAATDALS